MASDTQDEGVRHGQQAVDAMPFSHALGIEVTAMDATEVRARMPWAPERCTGGGILHGGALTAFADTLGALVAGLNQPPGTRSSTLELKTNFFRPIVEAYVEGVARPMHVGRTSIVVQTELLDAQGRRAGLVIQTQALRPLDG